MEIAYGLKKMKACSPAEVLTCSCLVVLQFESYLRTIFILVLGNQEMNMFKFPCRMQKIKQSSLVKRTFV